MRGQACGNACVPWLPPGPRDGLQRECHRMTCLVKRLTVVSCLCHGRWPIGLDSRILLTRTGDSTSSTTGYRRMARVPSDEWKSLPVTRRQRLELLTILILEHHV